MHRVEDGVLGKQEGVFAPGREWVAERQEVTHVDQGRDEIKEHRRVRNPVDAARSSDPEDLRKLNERAARDDAVADHLAGDEGNAVTLEEGRWLAQQQRKARLIRHHVGRRSGVGQRVASISGSHPGDHGAAPRRWGQHPYCSSPRAAGASRCARRPCFTRHPLSAYLMSHTKPGSRCGGRTATPSSHLFHRFTGASSLLADRRRCHLRVCVPVSAALRGSFLSWGGMTQACSCCFRSAGPRHPRTMTPFRGF
eukprot:scaffold555_cov109-Isochrysis_galbana.AAC.3